MKMQHRTLPQLGGELFLADGGLETTLVFHERVDLPHFAAFLLLETREGMETLRNYFLSYVDVARRSARGIVLETPTWRANPDWGARLGYDMRRLGEANRRAVELLTGIRAHFAPPDTPVVVSGNFGPRGAGYRAQSRMSVDQARAYHSWQMEIFADTDADMAAAFTMNYTEEAIGIALAAQDAGMPVAISFTVETDGRLPSGSALSEAIERTDEVTDAYPAYYMINCAHPEHFERTLREGGAWASRLRGVRANASRRSHAELDESSDLDIGDARELALQYRALRRVLPQLAVAGGCCGTDVRHVQAIAEALAR